jgi:hypothetical protein
MAEEWADYDLLRLEGLAGPRPPDTHGELEPAEEVEVLVSIKVG